MFWKNLSHGLVTKDALELFLTPVSEFGDSMSGSVLCISLFDKSESGLKVGSSEIVFGSGEVRLSVLLHEVLELSVHLGMSGSQEIDSCNGRKAKSNC